MLPFKPLDFSGPMRVGSFHSKTGLLRRPGFCLTTYPVGAVWDVHTSPDHGNGMLDGLHRRVRAGVRAVHPALRLDVNGLAFPVLEKSRH